MMEPGIYSVYGNPSDELREVLKGFNGEYMSPIGGRVYALNLNDKSKTKRLGLCPGLFVLCFFYIHYLF